MPANPAQDEGRWRSIIRSAVDAIVLIDERGRIEAFNPAAEVLFGYSEQELLGQNVSILMPPPYRDEHDGYLARYLRGGERRIIGIGREVTALRRDGTTVPVHLAVGEAEVGGERKFTGIIHDLSERVALEERLRASEARWRAVIESAVDGIIVIDSRGRIESFNPGAQRLFGYSEAEAIGQNVSILMPPPYHEEHDAYMARYLETGVAKIIGIGREVRGRRRDGTTFPVHLSVAEMAVNGERKFTGILHDLSSRISIEALLREQTALARLGEMAAVIAHEVKNPLAGVRGAIQVIGGRLPKDSKDAAIVKEILTRLDALNDLMKDLLVFARPAQPRLAPIDIGGLIRTTAELLTTDPAFRHVTIESDGDGAIVMADAEQLKIVFQNILLNGAQAMAEGGTIRVSIAQAGGTCTVTVRDTGPGVPAEVQESIFTPFFTTKARGTGLGLPTAKRILEAHGGTIALTCPPGGGTIIRLTLPLRASGGSGST